jgi:hypothetical protein
MARAAGAPTDDPAAEARNEQKKNTKRVGDEAIPSSLSAP